MLTLDVLSLRSPAIRMLESRINPMLAGLAANDGFQSFFFRSAANSLAAPTLVRRVALELGRQSMAHFLGLVVGGANFEIPLRIGP